MKFEYLKSVDDADLPKKVRPSKIKALPFWPEVEETLRATQESGHAPFKRGVVINLADYKDKTKKLKQPVIGVLTNMRSMLKKYRVQSKIKLTQRGDRVFLVAS